MGDKVYKNENGEMVVVKKEKKKRQLVIDMDKVFGVLCVGVSITALGFSLYSIKKIRGFSKKIGMSIDDLESRTHVDISDALVNKFTEKAVQKAADNAAKAVSEQLRLDMHDILSSKVSDAVANQYDNVKDEVTKELRKKVNCISISAIKSEIKDEATRKITDKLATEMDDILSAQTDKLENMAKAYKDMGEFIKSKA